MNAILFSLYYSKLQLSVLLGIHQDCQSVGFEMALESLATPKSKAAHSHLVKGLT